MCLSLGMPPLISLPSVHSLSPFISPSLLSHLDASFSLHSSALYSEITLLSHMRAPGGVLPLSLRLFRPLISFPSLAFILRFPLPSSPILMVRETWAGCNVSVLPSMPLAVLTVLNSANKQEQEGILGGGQTVHLEGAHPSHPMHLPHASSLLSASLFLSLMCFSHKIATRLFTFI